MVFRVEKNSNYTVISNYHLREKNMSLKAKGLLSWMLSNDDNWDYSIAGIVANCKENETAIKSTLNELQDFGYLEIIKKNPDEHISTIHYEYLIHEQSIKSQEGGFLALENLDIENQGQINTKQINTKKEIISSKDEIYQKTSSSSTSQFLRSSSRKTVNDSIYIDKFLEMYNRLSLSTVRKLTDKRKKAIVKLYRNYTEDDIKQVMKNIQESDFLSGRSSDFQATIDWILKEDNFLKILEGKYQHSYSRGGASDMNRRSSGRTVEQKQQLRKDIENGKFEKF